MCIPAVCRGRASIATSLTRARHIHIACPGLAPAHRHRGGLHRPPRGARRLTALTNSRDPARVQVGAARLQCRWYDSVCYDTAAELGIAPNVQDSLTRVQGGGEMRPGHRAQRRSLQMTRRTGQLARCHLQCISVTGARRVRTPGGCVHRPRRNMLPGFCKSVLGDGSGVRVTQVGD